MNQLDVMDSILEKSMISLKEEIKIDIEEIEETEEEELENSDDIDTGEKAQSWKIYSIFATRFGMFIDGTTVYAGKFS